ncbi:MAG: carotenoid oxygenase family protein, partial [Pseudomonadota bacterium]|nr:carotenoid oxygenase family protein [Pseudomonadota bacterium]
MYQPQTNLVKRSLDDYPVSDKCLGSTPQFEDAPAWIYNHDNPYLHGVYAPTNRELDQDKLEVIGELPSDLRGTYYRNGANPVFEPKNRYHPFDGDGMVHALHINDDGARYVNRWIDTPAFSDEATAGESVSPGVMGPFDYSVSEFGIKDTSNTDIFALNGDLVSLWYNAGNPIALDPM